MHLRGTFTCARAAARRMREQGEGGRIICVGSPTGQVGNFGQTNYAAAKAGIVGMVRTWSMELARANITVNAVIPVAATGMTETVPFLKPYVTALREGRPLPPYARRELSFGPPEDVTGLVVFLASDAAAGVSGQAIGLGGDRLALWSHPAEAVVEFGDGGWTAESIAEVWPERFARHEQTAGPAAFPSRTEDAPMPIDLDAVTAIDMHVHVESDGHGTSRSTTSSWTRRRSTSRRAHNRTPALEEIAAYYRERRLAAVVFTVDAHTALGHPALSSQDIVTGAAEHSDVLVPFASVDPRTRGVGRGAGCATWPRPAHAASSSTRLCNRSSRTTRVLPAVRGRRRARHRRSSSTPARPASARDCREGAASSCATPIRCCSTTSRPTIPG